MLFIIQFLLGTVLLLALLYPFFKIYIFVRDSIRMILYKKGHRVFTIPELQKLGLTHKVENGIVEGTVVSKNDKEYFGETFEVETIVIDEEELEKRRKKKEEKEKLSYFEDPIKKFKNFDY